MFGYYAAADVAFVEGSLLAARRTQNLIEPIARRCSPRCRRTGTRSTSPTRACARSDAGAAIRVADAAGARHQGRALLDDVTARAAMRERALAFCAAHHRRDGSAVGVARASNAAADVVRLAP